MNRFPPAVQQPLLQAGWRPGREVSSLVDQWATLLRDRDGLVMSSEARDCLREFGGLLVKPPTTHGISSAPVSVLIDASLGVGEKDRWALFEPILRTPIFPLGEVDNGHYYLCIDGKARIYLVMDDVLGVARKFDIALVHLLLGVACFPMLP